MTIDALSITELAVQAEHEPDRELLDLEALRARVAESNDVVVPLREALSQAGRVLDNRYLQNLNISEIVHGRARVVDEILRLAWQTQDWPDSDNISLVAVGGYGRGELLPCSDIDLLILTHSNRNLEYTDAISSFLALCWDVGLEPGQSLRSIKQCREYASEDITVLTALMESRILIGPQWLHADMMSAINHRRIWPTKKFVRAKIEEQTKRHQKYRDIDYALEPNVKSSPGGLRDIQTIAWVAKRHFGASSFKDLVRLGFIKDSEEAMLNKGQQFLWKLRYGLHYLDGRRAEDRLLFDKQRELARLFGYEDDDKSLGVEKLMQHYYRAVANLRELNDVLLQHFDEAILRADEQEQIKPLNNRFQIHNDYIEAKDPAVFRRNPFALLEIFVLMAQNPHILGIRAGTIRLIRDHRRLINDEFRQDIRNISLFMELLRSPHQMTLQLRRMARYGILGRYLPEFGRITGQMQHDLFHIYSVDAHTLQVVENMRRFLLADAKEKFPVASQLALNLDKLELLYIAGLYHDIAKGRGGDHSKLGMQDAENFCRRHRLSERDTRLVSWLVDKHLLMSMTAQRKDISDPDVIREFSEIIGDQLHLDYLYTMTVADICATNPDLWNSWRASLMSQLYYNTRRALRQGLEKTVDRAELVTEKRDSARQLLQAAGVPDANIDSIWHTIGDEYFVREAVENIAWHTEAIAAHAGEGPLISIRESRNALAEDWITQVFIYTHNADFLFANSTAAFEELNLNIHGARIFLTEHDYCMDTYTVLEDDGQVVGDNGDRLEQVRSVLARNLAAGHLPMAPARVHRSRREKYFSRPIEVSLSNPADNLYSILEVNCSDQPGILACVGKVLAERDISLKDARITTLGERVEDLFFITGADGKPLAGKDYIDALIAEIRSALEERLAL